MRKFFNKCYFKSGLVFKFVVGILLIVYSILLISLFVYAFINSAKDPWSFIEDSVRFPKEWHFENYLKVIENLKSQKNAISPIYYIEHMFGGSLLYSILCSSGIMIATGLMAYACAMFPCKLSSAIYYIVIFVITIPIIGSLPSEMKVIQDLKLYDKIGSAFFLKFSFGNIYFLLLYETIKKVPKDYKEAAEIDGASNMRIMLQVMLPLIKNIFGSIFLVQFISFWNDYSTPMIYFPSFPNISLGIINFAFSTSGAIAEEPYKLAACFVALLPILLIFIIFQRKLMDNISAGGLKG